MHTGGSAVLQVGSSYPSASMTRRPRFPAAAVPPSEIVTLVNMASVESVAFAVWIRVIVAAAFASWLIPFAVDP